jgi:hypothetical protein
VLAPTHPMNENDVFDKLSTPCFFCTIAISIATTLFGSMCTLITGLAVGTSTPTIRLFPSVSSSSPSRPACLICQSQDAPNGTWTIDMNTTYDHTTPLTPFRMSSSGFPYWTSDGMRGLDGSATQTVPKCNAAPFVFRTGH